VEAQVIDKPIGGCFIKIQLWTGEKLILPRAQFPRSGPIAIGEKIDVRVQLVKVATEVRRSSRPSGLTGSKRTAKPRAATTTRASKRRAASAGSAQCG
jgi:hypothetical protein